MRAVWIILIFVSPVFSQKQYGSSVLVHTAFLQPSFGLVGFLPQGEINMEPGFWFSYWKKKDGIYPKFYFSTYKYSHLSIKELGDLKISDKEKKVGGCFYGGLTYKYTDFLVGYSKEIEPSYSLATRFQIYKHKSIFLKYQESLDKSSKSYQINFLTGDKLKIGFQLGKNFNPEGKELTGGLSVSMNIDLWNVESFVESSDKTSAFFVSGQTEEFYQDYIREETNPIYKPKNENFQNKGNLKPFVPYSIEKKPKREYKTYPLNIDELLRENIPITQAIQISKASQNIDSYNQLKTTLSIKIVKKINRLQYLKNRANK